MGLKRFFFIFFLDAYILFELQDGHLDLQEVITRGWTRASVHHIVRLLKEMHCWEKKQTNKKVSATGCPLIMRWEKKKKISFLITWKTLTEFKDYVFHTFS